MINVSEQTDPVNRIEAADIEQAERVLEDMDMLDKLGVVAMSTDAKQIGQTL